LNRQDLQMIGARVMPKKLARSRKNGGRGWDRTSDRYDVNVVRGIDFRAKSTKKRSPG
jgi:hypothetical protein